MADHPGGSGGHPVAGPEQRARFSFFPDEPGLYPDLHHADPLYLSASVYIFIPYAVVEGGAGVLLHPRRVPHDPGNHLFADIPR